MTSGGLSYPLLIVYGLAAGSIGAFAVPTRDALLPIGGRQGNLPRAVALATALQFVGQLVGIACASQADRVGAVPLLLLHAALVLLGCVRASGACPIRRRIRRPGIRASGAAIADGVAEAARSEQIWPVLLINFGIGIFYVGPFMAVLPLVVRDNYHGGAAEIAYVNLAFWAAHHRRRPSPSRGWRGGSRCAAGWSVGAVVGRRGDPGGDGNAAAVLGVRGADASSGASARASP